MAKRSKRRNNRRQAGVSVDGEMAPANPLLSRQDRELFRRALAGSVNRAMAADGDAASMLLRGGEPEPPKTVADAALFARAVSGVAPLSVDRVRPHGQRPPPLPLPAEQLLHAAEHRHELAVFGGFEGEVAERLWFARSGLQDRVLRKLRRGRLPAEAELDLHGLFVPEAHAAVEQLIQEAIEREVRCVRIIHGKGNRSLGQQPVLKGNVDRWLRSRDEVLAFCSAPPDQGGAGAVLVLLKRG